MKVKAGMFSVSKDWNPKQKKLTSLLADDKTARQALQCCLSLHGEVHDLQRTRGRNNVYQELIQDIDPAVFRLILPGIFGSIAWNIWHITRIEDAVANILIANDKPIFNSAWKKKTKSPYPDSGNAFTPERMELFSQAIDLDALLDYRKAVGNQTRKILSELDPSGLNRKPAEAQLKRLLGAEIVTEEKDSIWLLDFWAKKTAAGLLKMPVTRHQIVHINSALRIKARVSGKSTDRNS